jgi:hypothetical protein
VAALLAAPLTAGVAAAQALETPVPSPRARVEQRVGVTDFSLEYSSPAVKGRKIWGELVPHDKPWRAGANAPTKLTASRDFTVGGKLVKAGSYTIFMIPAKTGGWAVALSTDLAANQGNYDAKKDAARITVQPQVLGAPRERLTYVFSDTTDDRTSLDLEWERVRIRVPIAVDTRAHVGAAIEKATGEAWRPHFLAGNYLYEAGELERALTLLDKSIAIQPTWRNEWTRALVLGKQGKKADATAGANRAMALGASDPIFQQFIKPDVTKAIASWK